MYFCQCHFLQVNLIELALLLQRFMKSITVESCSRNELVAKPIRLSRRDSLQILYKSCSTLHRMHPTRNPEIDDDVRKVMSSARKHDLNESNQASVPEIHHRQFNNCQVQTPNTCFMPNKQWMQQKSCITNRIVETL